ncbi:DUF1672 family protein [Bacillus sp. CGMCC 1.16541]|uniref:DUF1672 family protein n=1 Tax=Bacillus sp. CGMCC 1.16541 TaxID=2185143 RepID=UPI001EF5F9DA|nr:DUF1672 family protein [Bacillus sp. CGMCC 1.16541]
MMVINSKTLLCTVGISLILGGCSDMNSTNMNQESKPVTETQAASSEEPMVSVQDYKGEGYALPYGNETDKMADEHLPQIEEAATTFFKETYKTDVIVHNVVGAKDGATVFVESKGEPHFYTYAVVPIDVKEKQVKTDEIWADEFQVENAIKGGLYAMIFKDEFKNLDRYLQSLAKEGQVTGKTEEALQNVGGQGFMTPYYFISMTSKEEAIKPVYERYIRNPDERVENLRDAYDENQFNSNNFNITIQFFMGDKKAEPNKELFNRVVKDLEEMASIPKGSYSVFLNDHFIDKQSGDGTKDNSLERSFPDYIIKQ